MERIKKDIVEYIRLFLKNESISEHTPLLENGLLDSLGIITLLTFIEDNYRINLSDSDFDIDNFTSIDHLVNKLFQNKCESLKTEK